MYDGIFDIYTKTSFNNLLNETFNRMKFELIGIDIGEVTIVNYPYFRNLGYAK